MDDSLDLGAGGLLPGEEATGRASVVAIRSAWYVACGADELRGKPLAQTILGVPLVLFRDGGGAAHAVLDRCPHRMVPLSLGAVVDGQLECGYHGWRFDGEGRCKVVPGLCSMEVAASRDVPAFATREQDGWILVWAQADEEPTSEPFRPRTAGLPGYLHVQRSVEFPGSLHASLENALDVPHTAFLHRGLFRGGREPVEITAVLTRTPSLVQAEFLGEPRPEGLAAKMLAPSGGTLTHFDRFHLPSIAEVEYKLGDDTHIVTTSWCTPVEAFRTRVHALVSLKTPIPNWLIKPLLEPFAMRIFRQDAWILGEQTQAIRKWGGERFQSTEIDLVGAQIWRLLKRAAAGAELVEDDPWRKEVKLRV